MSIEQFKAFRDRVNADPKLQNQMIAERHQGNRAGAASRSLMAIGAELGYRFSAQDFHAGLALATDDDALSDFELELVQAASSGGGSGTCALPDPCPAGSKPA